MTPERKKWWDSLPVEEKRVRRTIKTLKGNINCCKQNIADELFDISNDSKIGKNQLKAAKDELRETKLAIKALRKQIAMRLISDVWNDHYCPCCDNFVWQPEEGDYFGGPPKYCEGCGQKLGEGLII